ncbi:hypothetical protein LINPERHAP2_LOCUS18457 [Linum perenne]
MVNRTAEDSARGRLEAVLWQEEALWLQKSRSKWVVEGDRNTNFFHMSTLRRRSFNRITRIKNGEGVWIESQPDLKILATEYFKEFYNSRGAASSFLQGKLEDGSSYFCTAVYASPVPTERVLLWDALKRISSSMVHPWITLGDFNSILSADDKSGGAPFNRARNKSFIDMFDICGFSDLRVQGPRFTWARNGILVRLDRALVNYRWLDLFPDSSTLHLHKLKSDHRPILVRPQAQVFQSNDKPFRFISAWFTHASFNYFLSKKWLKGHELPDALCSLSNDLCHWNKHVFGNIFRRKKEAYEPADAR